MMRVRSASAGHLAVGGAERIVQIRHVDAAHHVEHAHAAPVGGPRHVAAAPRRVGVVHRANQPRLDADVLEDFLLVPDVIAGRDDIHALRDQAVADLARDAVAAGRVLAVGDDQIDPVMRDERANAHPHQVASGAADDVADEEQFH